MGAFKPRADVRPGTRCHWVLLQIRQAQLKLSPMLFRQGEGFDISFLGHGLPNGLGKLDSLAYGELLRFVQKVQSHSRNLAGARLGT